MKALKDILDSKVDGAILITVGDTDGDGQKGVRAYVFGDIPFDGEDKPVGLLSSPEFEPADAGSLLGQIKNATKWATDILGKIPFFPHPNAAKRATGRRLSGRTTAPKKTRRAPKADKPSNGEG